MKAYFHNHRMMNLLEEFIQRNHNRGVDMHADAKS